MTTIVEFLTARLAEREALALATTPVPVPGEWKATRDKHADDDAPLKLVQGRDEIEPGHDHYGHGNPVIVIAADWQDEAEANVRFIAANDPAFVLAAVEAGRRRLQRHRPETIEFYDGRVVATFTVCERCGNGGTTQDAWPCAELKDDAAPFAEHPDFAEAWRWRP